MISVLLAVHNNFDGMLLKTLESVGSQSYKDWELVVVNDASFDDSADIIRTFKNRFFEKVIIIENEKNVGLTKSLILAAQVARGSYFARIDSGDVFLPKKLQKQLEYMNNHHDVGVVGCNYVNLGVGERKEIVVPETDDRIRATILKRNPFAHSCVLMSANMYKKVGGYDEKILYGQDYDLWFRILRVAKGANLQEFLCERNINTESISYRKQKEQMAQCVKTIWKYMNKWNILNYRFFFEPLLVILIPQSLKEIVRKSLG